MSRLVSVFQSLLAALTVIAVGYNFLMMINSSEGRRMNDALLLEISERQATLSSLQNEHAFLTDRTDRLLAGHIDEDLLDERVRGVLGLVRPDEYLVRMEDLGKLAELGAEEAREAERLAASAEPALRYAGLEGLLLRTTDTGA